MARERILITVKTYPTLSTKYTELACTAGFRPDGTWIRLYPVPFRSLQNDQRYAKYQWLEADIQRNPADPRPESYRIIDTGRIALLDKMTTAREWEDRRKLVLGTEPVHTNLTNLIAAAHANTLSLATFKPARIADFIIEDVEAEWPEHKITEITQKLKQGNLFGDGPQEDFKVMPKLPKKFSYQFEDDTGRASTLMIEDWEIGQLYWNCVKGYGEANAPAKVAEKYMNDFARTKDLHLFLGTTHQWHVRKAPNPFVIIGTFHPPHQTQTSLL
ncbi:MAG: hypothetical protein K0U74_12265 [Alphaproteobacteria bacterium]|nr:hypothetical protein [Alphaproteobacteria bacterium]